MESFLTVVRTLCDRDRVRMVKLLQGSSLSAAELSEILGLPEVDVRDHVSVLKETSLVSEVGEGEKKVLRINPERHNLYGAVVLALLDGWLNEDADVVADRENAGRILGGRE